MKRSRLWITLLVLLLSFSLVGTALAAEGTPPVTYADENEAVKGVEAAPLTAGIDAVATDYVFASSSGTYTEITGGTQVTTSCDDTNYNNLPIGFTFTFDGVAYTAFSIQCNGFIAMGATVASSYTPISTGSTNNIIAAMGRDLQTNTADSEIRYELQGTSPNQVLVVQYKNMRRYGGTETYNFQIRLHETMGVIEIVYGAFTKDATAVYPQVGLRGASSADYNNRMTDATHFWDTSLPGTANSSSMTLSQTVMPASGLTYTWSPPILPGFGASAKQAASNVLVGEPITYNLYVTNSGIADSTGTVLTDTLPVDVTYVAGSLVCSAGACNYNAIDNQVEWSGAVTVGDTVTVTFQVDTDALPCGALVNNTAQIYDPTADETWNVSAATGVASSIPAIIYGFEPIDWTAFGWTSGIIFDPGTDPVWTRETAGTSPTILPHSGAAMAKFNSFSTGVGGIAHLTTPALDLSTLVLTPTLSFYMSHDTGFSTSADQIQVQVSTDGTTFTNVGAPILRYDAAYVTPGWGHHMVDLSAYAAETSVYVRFLATSAYGNNFFLDDVRIADPWSPCPAVFIMPVTQNEVVCIGGDVSYDFTVINNTPDTQAIDLVYTHTWPIIGAPDATPILAPGENFQFTVIHHIPWAAAAGDADVLEVRATAGSLMEIATATTSAAIAAGWEDVNDLIPVEREVRAPSVVYWDGKLYKIGGYGYPGGVGGAQAWLDIYDIATGAWTAGADMPGIRYWLNCEAIDAKIYCAGGYSTSGQTTLYIYDIATNAWSTGAALAAYRYDYASVALGGKYYIIGGYAAGYSSAMLVYDPATNAWSTLASMSTVRRYFHAGVIGGKIYVAGGYTGSLYLSSMEIYDPATNTWSAGPDMPSAWANAADGVLYDRYLILAGGSPNSTSGASSGALIYDAVLNLWNWLPNFNHMVYAAEGDTDGTNFYVVSGRQYTGAWSNSPYVTIVVECDTTCTPVTDLGFTVNPANPLQGLPATFDATLTAGSLPIFYDWNFGDGGTGLGSPVNYAYLNAGIYTTGLTATNCDGASTATYSEDVTVLLPPTIDPPDPLSSLQSPNTVVTQTVQICNTGDLTLTWELGEVPGVPAPLIAAGPLPAVAPKPAEPIMRLADGSVDCAAYENYTRFEPVEVAAACGSPALAVSGAGTFSPTDFGYAQDIGYISDNFVNFPLGNFTGQTVVGTNATPYYGMDFDPMGTTLYALNDTTDELGTIDLASGAFTGLVPAVPPVAAVNWTGMAIDPTTGVFYLSTATDLYTIDPGTGITTTIGAFNTGGTMIAIAINTDGEMYGHDITTDSIYTIDMTTGATTLVGLTGYAANFAQGMDFDNDDGTLYIFLYIGSGANVYGTVNLDTGAVTPLAVSAPQGEFEGATQTFSFDIPWLTETPITGTLLAGMCSDIDVAFDSTGLALGEYTGALRFTSNDPFMPATFVPVTLTVANIVDLSISKIDNLDPVNAGDTLLYTVTVVNNGPEASQATVFTDTLPVGFDFVAATPGCVEDAGEVVCPVGVLNMGDTAVYTITAIPTASGEYQNLVFIANPDFDPDVNNNVDEEWTLVGPGFITYDPTSFHSIQITDEMVDYTLQICNVSNQVVNWDLEEAPPVLRLPQGLVGPLQPRSQAAIMRLTDGSVDCAAYENSIYAEPLEVAAACGGPALAQQAMGALAPTDLGYALDLRYRRWVEFDLNNFSGQTVISPTYNANAAFYGLDFDPTGTTLYAWSAAYWWMFTVDPTTGDMTPLSFTPGPPTGSYTGMTIDPVTGVMYMSSSDTLYTIDPTTGMSTTVGLFGTGGLMIEIAMNPAGEMYGHDISTDSIYSIDPATGAATLIGPTGYAANYAQGMDFDNDDGTLYIWLYIGSGANVYGTVNLTTGAVTPLATSAPLGEFEGTTQTVVPYDIPWLSEDPLAGILDPGACEVITITFDSTGLALGDYFGNLLLNADDPFMPQSVIPVTLTVVELQTVDFVYHDLEDAVAVGEDLYLTGSFVENWPPDYLLMTPNADNSVFTATLQLMADTYEYKYVVNGSWGNGAGELLQSVNRMVTVADDMTIDDYRNVIVGWSQLNGPLAIDISLGENTGAIEAEVWIFNVTSESPTERGRSYAAEIGFGTQADMSDFVWIPLEYVGEAGNNDLLTAVFTPTVTGVYTYVVRFDANWAEGNPNIGWTYAAEEGVLTVTEYIPPYIKVFLPTILRMH